MLKNKNEINMVRVSLNWTETKVSKVNFRAFGAFWGIFDVSDRQLNSKCILDALLAPFLSKKLKGLYFIPKKTKIIYFDTTFFKILRPCW